MTIEEVIAFAKKEGYYSAKHLGQWRDYEIYEPIFSRQSIPEEEDFCPYKSFSIIGHPLIILVKEGTIRMSSLEEAHQQIREAVKK